MVQLQKQLMRNGTIEIKLPYPIRWGFIRFYIKRKIGFSFDQRSLFQLLQNNNIDLPQHSKWLKETSQAVIVLETLYAGAQSYCIERRVRDNFTKKGLSLAMSEAGEEVTSKIVDCYMKSEKLGYKKMPGKKKVVRR